MASSQLDQGISYVVGISHVPAPSAPPPLPPPPRVTAPPSHKRCLEADVALTDIVKTQAEMIAKLTDICKDDNESFAKLTGICKEQAVQLKHQGKLLMQTVEALFPPSSATRRSASATRRRRPRTRAILPSRPSRRRTATEWRVGVVGPDRVGQARPDRLTGSANWLK